MKPQSSKSKRRLTGTPDKQESHRIHCVHNDAGGFPERSTRPMVGSRYIRRTCRRWLTELQEFPALPERSVRSGNAFHFYGQRYLLGSDRIDRCFFERSKSLHRVYLPGVALPRHTSEKRVLYAGDRLFGVRFQRTDQPAKGPHFAEFGSTNPRPAQSVTTLLQRNGRSGVRNARCSTGGCDWRSLLGFHFLCQIEFDH